MIKLTGQLLLLWWLLLIMEVIGMTLVDKVLRGIAERGCGEGEEATGRGSWCTRGRVIAAKFLSVDGCLNGKGQGKMGVEEITRSSNGQAGPNYIEVSSSTMKMKSQ